VYLELDNKGLNLAETISCHVHFSSLFTVGASGPEVLEPKHYSVLFYSLFTVTELFYTVWCELLTTFLKKLQIKISVVG